MFISHKTQLNQIKLISEMKNLLWCTQISILILVVIIIMSWPLDFEVFSLSVILSNLWGILYRNLPLTKNITNFHWRKWWEKKCILLFFFKCTYSINYVLLWTPFTLTCKCWATNKNLPTTAMYGYRISLEDLLEVMDDRDKWQ